MTALQDLQHPSLPGFWAFIKEREDIRIRKQAGNAVPWTDDPTLQQYHFCNIRREDDYGTQWYLSQTANLKGRSQLWSSVLYRLVNNIQWFESLGALFTRKGWEEHRQLWRRRILRAPKISNSAYIVLQHNLSTSRQTRLITCLDSLRDKLNETWFDFANTFHGGIAWKDLQKIAGVGPFVALQVYRDLLLTKALPFDENEFTYLGPGAREGLRMLIGYFNLSYKVMYEETLKLHREQPPIHGGELVLGDVEHCLCEYNKYVKFRENRGKRRLYRPRKGAHAY